MTKTGLVQLFGMAGMLTVTLNGKLPPGDSEPRLQVIVPALPALGVVQLAPGAEIDANVVLPERVVLALSASCGVARSTITFVAAAAPPFFASTW